jgi:hypothetical protein
MAHIEPAITKRTLMSVAAGVASVSKRIETQASQPLTPNSPGVKLRRAEDLFRKAMGR